jgi:hypothetical protein
MATYIPQIGASGLYNLSTPFNTRLRANVPYECIAVRKLADILITNEDAEKIFYLDQELTNVEYLRDVADGVSIVTLQSKSGDLVYVPSSYILSYPNIGGVVYAPMMLGVTLGNIPLNLNLGFIKDKIAADIAELLGVEATVEAVVIGDETIVSDTNHASIQSARQNAIGIIETDYAKYLRAAAQRDTAYAKIQQLENFIRTNMPAP